MKLPFFQSPQYQGTKNVSILRAGGQLEKLCQMHHGLMIMLWVLTYYAPMANGLNTYYYSSQFNNLKAKLIMPNAPDITGNNIAQDVIEAKLRLHVSNFYSIDSNEISDVNVGRTEFMSAKVTSDSLIVRYNQLVTYSSTTEQDMDGTLSIALDPFQTEQSREIFLNELEATSITQVFKSVTSIEAVTCPQDDLCQVSQGGPTQQPTRTSTFLPSFRPTIKPSLSPIAANTNNPPIPALVSTPIASTFAQPTLTPSTTVPTIASFPVYEDTVKIDSFITITLRKDFGAQNVISHQTFGLTRDDASQFERAMSAHIDNYYESFYDEYADDDTFERPGIAAKPFWNSQTNTILIATADVTAGFMIIYKQSVKYKTYESANFEYTAIGKQKRALELIRAPIQKEPGELIGALNFLPGISAVADLNTSEGHIFQHSSKLDSSVASFATGSEEMLDSFDSAQFDRTMEDQIGNYYDALKSGLIFDVQCLTSTLSLQLTPKQKLGTKYLFLEYSNNFRYRSIKRAMQKDENEVSFDWFKDNGPASGESALDRFVREMDIKYEGIYEINFVGTRDEWVTYLTDEAKGIVIRTMVLPVVGLVVGLICLVCGCFCYRRGCRLNCNLFNKVDDDESRHYSKSSSSKKLDSSKGDSDRKEKMKKQRSSKRMEKMSNQRSSKRLDKKRGSSRKISDDSSKESRSKESRSYASQSRTNDGAYVGNIEDDGYSRSSIDNSTLVSDPNMAAFSQLIAEENEDGKSLPPKSITGMFKMNPPPPTLAEMYNALPPEARRSHSIGLGSPANMAVQQGSAAQHLRGIDGVPGGMANSLPPMPIRSNSVSGRSGGFASLQHPQQVPPSAMRRDSSIGSANGVPRRGSIGIGSNSGVAIDRRGSTGSQSNGSPMLHRGSVGSNAGSQNGGNIPPPPHQRMMRRNSATGAQLRAMSMQHNVSSFIPAGAISSDTNIDPYAAHSVNSSERQMNENYNSRQHPPSHYQHPGRHYERSQSMQPVNNRVPNDMNYSMNMGPTAGIRPEFGQRNGSERNGSDNYGVSNPGSLGVPSPDGFDDATKVHVSQADILRRD